MLLDSEDRGTETHKYLVGNGYARQIRLHYPYYFGATIRNHGDRYRPEWGYEDVAEWLSNRFGGVPHWGELIYVGRTSQLKFDETLDYLLYRGLWLRHQSDAALFRVWHE